jgi:hypothetical protein
MTAAPLPRPPFEPDDSANKSSDREQISTLLNENSAAIVPPGMINDGDASGGISPVLALKELLARWHREQNKIQDLLGSLSFALRSFNNLNQFFRIDSLSC